MWRQEKKIPLQVLYGPFFARLILNFEHHRYLICYEIDLLRIEQYTINREISIASDWHMIFNEFLERLNHISSTCGLQ